MGEERSSFKGAEAIFLALLMIGLIGLLFLIIFGNLSNNLGFTQTSTVFSNETITLTNTNGVSPAGASNRINGAIDSSTVVITNASGGELVVSGNYTLSGVLFNATVNSEFVDQGVNVSYLVSYDGPGEINTENVIANLTSGATQFFTFSNVWFILTAIMILIAIVLGVIVLVKKSSSGAMGGGKSKGRSEFVS